MNYISQTAQAVVTIPQEDIAAEDYVVIIATDGTTTKTSGKLRPVEDGDDYTYSYQWQVTTPAVWTVSYKVYDELGNLGTTSDPETLDMTALVPAKAGNLKFVSYDAATDLLTLKL